MAAAARETSKEKDEKGEEEEEENEEDGMLDAARLMFDSYEPKAEREHEFDLCPRARRLVREQGDRDRHRGRLVVRCVSAADGLPGALQSGIFLWPAASALARFLLGSWKLGVDKSPLLAAIERDDPVTVMELGAGAGLTGLAAAKLLSMSRCVDRICVLTDRDASSCRMMRKSVRRNESLKEFVSCRPLTWGSAEDAARLVTEFGMGASGTNAASTAAAASRALIVIGSDLIYSSDVARSLLVTVHALLEATASASEFWLCSSFRHPETTDIVQEQCDSLGLSRATIFDSIGLQGGDSEMEAGDGDPDHALPAEPAVMLERFQLSGGKELALSATTTVSLCPPLQDGASFAPTDLAASMRRIAKDSRGLKARLCSIRHDADFVAVVRAGFSGCTAFGNARAGVWYAPDFEESVFDEPEGSTHHQPRAGVARFKSADGHVPRGWCFSMARPNMHVALQLARAPADRPAVLLVDATRAGKSCPDSLTRTVPLWCHVVNQALGLSVQENPLSLPSWLPASDAERVSYAQVQEWAQALRSAMDPALLGEMQQAARSRGPIAPCWVRRRDGRFDSLVYTIEFGPEPNQSVDIDPESDTTLEDPVRAVLTALAPPRQWVVCVSASAHARSLQDQREARGGWSYVPGAADDDDAWSLGLTPSELWDNVDELCDEANMSTLSDDDVREHVLHLVTVGRERAADAQDNLRSSCCIFRMPGVSLHGALYPVRNAAARAHVLARALDRDGILSCTCGAATNAASLCALGTSVVCVDTSDSRGPLALLAECNNYVYLPASSDTRARRTSESGAWRKSILPAFYERLYVALSCGAKVFLLGHDVGAMGALCLATRLATLGPAHSATPPMPTKEQVRAHQFAMHVAMELARGKVGLHIPRWLLKELY